MQPPYLCTCSTDMFPPSAPHVVSSPCVICPHSAVFQATHPSPHYPAVPLSNRHVPRLSVFRCVDPRYRHADCRHWGCGLPFRLYRTAEGQCDGHLDRSSGHQRPRYPPPPSRVARATCAVHVGMKVRGMLMVAPVALRWWMSWWWLLVLSVDCR